MAKAVCPECMQVSLCNCAPTFDFEHRTDRGRATTHVAVTIGGSLAATATLMGKLDAAQVAAIYKYERYRFIRVRPERE